MSALLKSRLRLTNGISNEKAGLVDRFGTASLFLWGIKYSSSHVNGIPKSPSICVGKNHASINKQYNLR